MKATGGALVALLLALGSISATGVAQAAPGVPAICAGELKSAKRFDTDVSRLALAGTLGLDGRTVNLRDTATAWQFHDEYDNTWNNRFHGMEWLVPAHYAGVDAVALLVEREAALPDPGPAAGSIGLRSSGWTTGAIRIRQGVVNCLYQLTRDPRLISVAESLAAANLDPARYKGRPRSQPHNLGMLANLMLREAATVFDRMDWQAAAVDRMRVDADFVFNACGMTVEQSTAYHLLNIAAWQRALRSFDDTEAALIGASITEGQRAAAALTRPDGVLEAIGDGNQRDNSAMLSRFADGDLRLWCKARGWAANRSATSVAHDDPGIHYTLRFGPRPKHHGHDDHGSLTWFAMGVPVLSDPGLFDKARSSRYSFARSALSHSVFAPLDRSLSVRTLGTRLSGSAGVDSYRLTTQAAGVTRIREVDVSLTEPMLQVRDHARTKAPELWIQYWQLDPQWEQVEGVTWQEPVAAHGKGLWLYAACSAGNTMRPAVTQIETYPERRTVLSALSLRCGGFGEEVTMNTLLLVSPVKGMLNWDEQTETYVVTPAN